MVDALAALAFLEGLLLLVVFGQLRLSLEDVGLWSDVGGLWTYANACCDYLL